MRFWNLIPDSSSPGDGVLDINGPIAAESWWGDECSSKDFVKALAEVRNVTVHINSPGGDVLAGAEIYSALMEHSLNGLGRVTVIITALAASAASVVAMAGDEILISPVAYMMIHNPWSFAIGDARDLRKAARTLDEITEGLITAYQRRTGKGRDELKRMLENETWMSAQRCVDEGFADGVYGVYGGEIRAAACAGASMMTGATPESIREMIARYEKARAEDPEKDPEETGEEPEEDPDKPEDEPEKDPDGDPDGDPEEDPEEAPEKEDAKRDEIRRRAEIAARAAIAAAAMNYLEA